MTHTYNIAGMTCNGCIATVKSGLLKLGNVLSADVQLESPQATITMDKHIPLTVLQQAIGKYSIAEADASMPDTAEALVDKNASYYPVFLIFGYIAGIATLIEYTKGSFDLMQWMGHFMAGFFLLFSFFKLLNLKGFAEGYAAYDIVAGKIAVYGYIYPFIELLLGVAYLTGFEPWLTNIVTVSVMSVSAVGVIRSLLRKSTFQCACLGTIIKLPLSKVTLFEDLLMVVMSCIMLLKMAAA